MTSDRPFLLTRAELQAGLQRGRLKIVEELNRPFDPGNQAHLPPSPAEAADPEERLARALREKRRRREVRSAPVDEKVRALMPGLVVEKLAAAIKLEDDRASVDAALDRATAGQAAVYATLASDPPICNGGFGEYFLKPAGALAAAAVEGFRTLGTRERAELLLQAMAYFPGGSAPTDIKERTRLLLRPGEPSRKGGVDFKSDWESFAKPIEKQYYALNNLKRMRPIHIDYIEANPGEFFVDP